jgi:S-methylmethionine-dependent homocysteine/selenocysteine methylase
MEKSNSIKDISFVTCFNTSPFILTEGAIVERLKQEFNIKMDDDIVHAGLIYNEKQADILRGMYKQYIDIAVKYDLPIMIMTPTRRANKERINRSLYCDKNVICDCVEFLSDIRNSYQLYKNKIFIGGLMGCKGDAYKSEDALSSDEAYHFHLWQVEQFKKAGVDYLFAGIMPSLSEAIGMAKAMQEARLPYIISFMIRNNGMLLDETTINNAIKAIDEATYLNPLCYMVNCIHPTVLNKALSSSSNQTALVGQRFAGIQANASELSPEELDCCCELKSDEPKQLVNTMEGLHIYKQIKIFGGCCGTDNRHIDELAKRMIRW